MINCPFKVGETHVLRNENGGRLFEIGEILEVIDEGLDTERWLLKEKSDIKEHPGYETWSWFLTRVKDKDAAISLVGALTTLYHEYGMQIRSLEEQRTKAWQRAANRYAYYGE